MAAAFMLLAAAALACALPAATASRVTLPVRAQPLAHVPAPEGLDFEGAGLVVSDNDIGVYCRPETGNYVLAGSEDPPCDPHDWADPDDFNRDFSDQATTQALRLAQRMGGLKLPNRMRGVVDLYDVTEDWLPIYDRSAIDGFYMACGSSGNQFKNAPGAGRWHLRRAISVARRWHDKYRIAA